MKNRRTITFNIGDENRIVVENINKDTIKSSIFSEPYHYILNALDHYIDALSDNRDNDLKGNDMWRNNIFAFIGERGSGKTSCMRSIVHLLEDPRNSQLDNVFLKSNFYALDMIDPSFIDNESNIIGVILATLYKKFLDHSQDINEGLKIKLAESFARVQHDFSRMMTERAIPDDDLEALSSLSAAIDLRTSMQDLIDKFMKYMGKEKAILLIPVDDIDLYSKAATIMVEQIRKYLVLPNVLVVMAVKLDQLAKLKRLQYSTEYRDDNQTLNDTDLDEMVDRYITKLVPYNHRVYMPESTVYWDAGLNINQKNTSCYQFESVRQAVPELIFRKTRYLFYNSAVKTSFIVPDNLRELRQIIRLLVDMKDYWQYDGDGKLIAEETNNKEVFKKYLFESWMMNHLGTDSQRGIKEFASISEAIQINATALRIIRDKFEKDKYFETKEPSVISNILKSNNQVYNIAIGDVLAIIDFLERKDITLEQMHFLFMIKTIYSMRLYEFYDEYIEELHDNKELNGEMSSERVLARGLYQDMKLPNYLKLVGGRFFNTRMIVELPKGADNPYRSNRVINLDALKALMKLCVENPQITMPIELKMAEVFMLCTARIYKSRHFSLPKDKAYIDSAYREYRELVYAASLARKPKGYWDIGSFLFNIVDIDRCYQRFDYGDKFVELMNQPYTLYEKSLYNGFKLLAKGDIRNMSPKDYLDYCNTHQSLLAAENTELPVLDKHIWLSWACVRNAEILCDLVSFLDEDEYKNSGDDVKILERFFLLMSQYSIYSYDKTGNGEEGDYYRINYRFARLVMETLKEINSSYSLKEIFKLIFDDFMITEKKNSEYYEGKIKKLMDNHYDEIHGQVPVITAESLESTLTKRKCSKSTLIDKILKLDARFRNEPYRNMLNEILPIPGKEQMTVDDVPQILEAINNGLNGLNNGNAETNNQNIVRTAEE